MLIHKCLDPKGWNSRRLIMRCIPVVAVVSVLESVAGSACGQTFLGPSPYLCAGDSPWDTGASGFVLETFEDGFNVAGVTSNGNLTGPGGITDSVDCDDGVIDGLGRNARSWFGSGSVGITFTFVPPLPQRAGIVWTDGVHNTSANSIHFEAFGPGGVPLGQIDGGHADTSQSSETGEDRFYGVENLAGVERIRIWQTSGCCGIEVDHLQFGGADPACDPIDFNGDGLYPDTADIDDFLSVFSGGACSNDPSCNDIDFNNDSLFPDTLDIDAMLSVFSGGTCLV